MFTEYPWQFFLQFRLKNGWCTACYCMSEQDRKFWTSIRKKNKLKGPPIYSTEQFYQVPKCLSPEINSIFQNQAHKSN